MHSRLMDQETLVDLTILWQLTISVAMCTILYYFLLSTVRRLILLIKERVLHIYGLTKQSDYVLCVILWVN
jgi:hypothetical protein